MNAKHEISEPQGSNELKLLEYETLRNELLENKKHLFERPIVIVAAAGVAAAQLKDNPHVLALPLFLVWILLVNLWFTINRLRSAARIAAYINIVIEPGSPVPWIGWENALRLHRIWNKRHGHAEKRRQIEQYIEFNAIPDAMTFYPVVLALHAVPIVFAATAAILFVGENSDKLAILMCVTTILSTFVFGAFVCLWRPAKMMDSIEIQRATWLAVLKEYGNQKKNT